MSAKPRDLLKRRRQRLGEVASLSALGAGQANGQYINSGGVLSVGSTTTRLAISACEAFLAQALTLIPATIAAGVAPPVGANTAAGQVRKVAVDLKSDGTVVFTVGALSPSGVQADAVLPATPIDSITVGWIEVPASFVADTTVLTVGMLKQMAYDSGVS